MANAMRRFLYKYFSGDYLHVVSLIASHYRVQRNRPSRPRDERAIYEEPKVRWTEELPEVKA